MLYLTLIPMSAVSLVMPGSGEPLRTRLSMGWFGPRGLASIVFAIIGLDAGLPHACEMALVVVYAVFMSLVLRGVTANSLANRLRRGS